jgi:hypothetical protein
MTQKALALAHSEIVDILEEDYTETKSELDINNYANEILKNIDWDNEVLMHKGLKWIVNEYIKKKGFNVN